MGFFREQFLIPYRVWRQATLPESMTFRTTTLNDLPPAHRVEVDAAVRELAEKGFRVAANLTTDPRPTIRASIVVLFHDDNRDRARIIYSAIGGEEELAVVIRTEFEDGTRITTSNAAVNANRFALDPRHDAISFRWIRSASALYEVHRRRIERFNQQGAHRAASVPRDAISHVQNEHRREMDRRAAAGQLRHYPSERLYRFTLRGAIIHVRELRPATRESAALAMDERARRELDSLSRE